MQQVLLFLLMFWVHVLQENPLKLKVFFPRPQKSCSVLTQHCHFEQLVNGCLNWRFYFFSEFGAVFFLPAKWHHELWNGVFEPCYFLHYKLRSSQVKLQKSITITKVLSLRSFTWSSNQLTLKKMFVSLPYHLGIF